MPKQIIFVGKDWYADECFSVAENLLKKFDTDFVLLRSEEITPDIKNAEAVLFVGEKEKIASALELYAEIKIIGNYAVVSDSINVGSEYRLKRGEMGREMIETTTCSELGIERVARVAFEYAQKKGESLLCVDSAGSDHTGEFRRRAVRDVAQDYPDVFSEDETIERAIMRIATDKNSGKIFLTNYLHGGMISNVLSSIAGEEGFSGLFGKTVLAAYGVESGRFGLTCFEKAVRFMIEESFAVE